MIAVINIGRKYLTGTYKEASVGNIIGYWFENADGPMFLIPANKHDDNGNKSLTTRRLKTSLIFSHQRLHKRQRNRSKNL